jgi:hypothetical protein
MQYRLLLMLRMLRMLNDGKLILIDVGDHDITVSPGSGLVTGVRSLNYDYFIHVSRITYHPYHVPGSGLVFCISSFLNYDYFIHI